MRDHVVTVPLRGIPAAGRPRSTKGEAVAFRSPGQSRPAGGRPIVLPRWPKYLIPTAIVVIAAIIVISVLAGVWTDFLWFRSIGFSSVFDTTYGTKWALFIVAALFMAAVIGLNVWIAYRIRPEHRPVSPEQQGLDAYRQVIDPHRRLFLGAVLGLIGLVSGLSAAGNWRTWLLFANRVPFGVKDPQFKLDVSFYVFVYPFIRMALSYLFAAILLSLLLSAAVHYLYGGLRPQQRGERATSAARSHLFVLAGIFVLLKAVAYWVDRYGINFSQRGVVTTGASYTDVNAILPAKTVLALIALICGVLFLAGAVRRSSLLPAIGFGLLVLSAIIIGGVYPAIIQQFVVKPNELNKETPYLSREIHNTRSAYGVTNAREIPYSAISTEPTAQLAKQVAAVPDVRLLDPGVVSSAFQQLQQVKSYYKFANVLSMDRYVTKGSAQPQDTVVGVRDMSGPPAGQASWINSHLVYTHGFGFVAAPTGTAATDGSPAFTESDIPPSGALGIFQPRVYFGEQETSYAIVGGHQELDFPNQSTGGQQNNTYQGSGGVPVGSTLDRLLFAVKFRQLNILLSGAIDSHSKIMYVRDPLSRVAKVAPFLTLDGDPYPVIANGQVSWVVDAYTTTDDYPYSERLGLQQATSNTYSPFGAVAGTGGQINYIRNSVKAVVNAYTGDVSLYQWGGKDPVLEAWMKAFPGVIKPTSAIPAALMPHLRYPEVLFDMQRQVLAQFHVQEAQEFYGGQNFWSVPTDPTQGRQSTVSQPPYYLTLTMPGQAQPAFSLTTSFTPRGRSNLAAYMAVDSNPASPDYGNIRILELPQDTAILGPQQVQSNFESDTSASKELSLFRQGGSKVTLGNLVTQPVGNGLLYTEPVYVSASAQGNAGSYPLLRRVFAYYGQNVGYAPTLQGALDQVFVGLTPPSTAPAPGAPGGSGGSTGKASAAVLKFVQQAEQFYQQAQAALKRGDFAAYGTLQNELKTALANAQKAAQGTSGSAKGTIPSSSPSPSPSP
jgi:uncharacterized membrane protein (UPF0182 family)